MDLHHLRVLPPSANWYCSKICDWGHSDVLGLLVAFGAKNCVFVYQVSADFDGDGVNVSFFAQLVRGKRDRRVAAVQFLTDSTGELRLVCGGEEGSVQIWDVTSLMLIEQHRKHKAEVMAVTVSSTLDANFVVAGDRQGRISAWERDAGNVSVFTPVSGDGIHSMAIAPHDKTLVAIGYRSGVLCLVDAAQGTIRHRLGGHDQEVQCVAWKSTVETNHPVIDDETKVIDSGHEVWLASSSRDKTIKVWKIATEEPVLEQVLRLPTGKQGMSFTQTKQLWLPIAWSGDNDELSKTPAKHCLWSGSFDGSLFRWEWNVATTEGQANSGKNRRAPCKPAVVKGGHSRMLFSIAMAPRGSSLTEDGLVSMLTVSLDRELRLWKENQVSKSVPAATCVEKLTGLGGHAYSISYSSATNVLAAGVGDQTIRLWNLAAGASDYQCDLMWRGLQSKVTCVQWHPFHRSLLAYGLEDGRIGVYDVHIKKYNHFRTSHDHEIKQLQWIVAHAKQSDDTSGVDDSFLESIKQLEAAQAQGQALEDALVVQESQTGKTRNGDEVKIILWSRDAAGHVLESNADAIDQNSREVMTGCTALAVDDHSELLTIGLSNGVVKVKNWRKTYDDNSIEINRFHEHSESVTCLAWSRGPNAGLLASGGQDGKIFVYSFAKSTTMAADDASIETSEKLQLLGGMEAHSNYITGLSWCTDGSVGLLASCSADGSVQVWNATTREREAFFNHHVGRVLSIDWVSMHTLATGGEDQTLRLWDYREQQKDPSSNQKKHGKVKQPRGINLHAGESREDPQTQKQKVVDTDTSSPTGNPGTTKNKSRKKSMMVFHPETKLTPAEIASACGKITGAKHAEDDAEKLDGVKANEWENIFLARTDRGSVRDFFASEAKRYQDGQEWESLANMLLLQGNVADALRIVAKEGALSATWLSYAPMAGTDVWREMTNLYAHQLDAQGDKKSAAFHFLSIDKVRSAITCLVSCDAYKEALALIRSRLGPQDPLLHDTLWKYSEVLAKCGHHGEAALALLQIGSVMAKTRAIHTLVNTGDMILVKSALELLVHAAHTLMEAIEGGGTDLDNDSGEFSFPASFFISIAGRALANYRFDIAETAGDLLHSQLVATSSQAPYRLTRCLLKILKTVYEHQPSNCKFDETKDEAEAINDLLQCLPPSHRDFFEFLTKPREDRKENDTDRLHDSVLSRYAIAIHQEKQLNKQQVEHHGAHFWFQVLNACRDSGYWFDAEGQAHVQEAQDLLVESNCFGEIEEVVTACAKEGPNSAISCLLQTAQRLLRFVIDVMSSSFIGALEHMRAGFLLLAQSDMRKGVEDNGTPSVPEEGIGDFRLDVMLLLFPLGFASPKELPQCGELLDEHLDTLVLMSSVLLSQCHIVLAAFVNSVSAEDNAFASLIGSLLRLLRTQFLDDEAALTLSQGLMDPLNQSQLQSLLNEMVVIAHQLPASLSATQEENVDSSAHEAADQAKSVSLKQALIDDVSDMRSRLTWSADGVKE